MNIKFNTNSTVPISLPSLPQGPNNPVMEDPQEIASVGLKIQQLIFNTFGKHLVKYNKGMRGDTPLLKGNVCTTSIHDPSNLDVIKSQEQIAEFVATCNQLIKDLYRQVIDWYYLDIEALNDETHTLAFTLSVSDYIVSTRMIMLILANTEDKNTGVLNVLKIISQLRTDNNLPFNMLDWLQDKFLQELIVMHDQHIKDTHGLTPENKTIQTAAWVTINGPFIIKCLTLIQTGFKDQWREIKTTIEKNRKKNNLKKKNKPRNVISCPLATTYLLSEDWTEGFRVLYELKEAVAEISGRVLTYNSGMVYKGSSKPMQEFFLEFNTFTKELYRTIIELCYLAVEKLQNKTDTLVFNLSVTDYILNLKMLGQILKTNDDDGYHDLINVFKKISMIRHKNKLPRNKLDSRQDKLLQKLIMMYHQRRQDTNGLSKEEKIIKTEEWFIANGKFIMESVKLIKIGFKNQWAEIQTKVEKLQTKTEKQTDSNVNTHRSNNDDLNQGFVDHLDTNSSGESELNKAVCYDSDRPQFTGRSDDNLFNNNINHNWGDQGTSSMHPKQSPQNIMK